MRASTSTGRVVSSKTQMVRFFCLVPVLVWAGCGAAGGGGNSQDLTSHNQASIRETAQGARQAEELFHKVRRLEIDAGLNGEKSVALMPKGLPFPGYGVYMGPLDVSPRGATIEMKGKWWATRLKMDAYELMLIPRF